MISTFLCFFMAFIIFIGTKNTKNEMARRNNAQAPKIKTSGSKINPHSDRLFIIKIFKYETKPKVYAAYRCFVGDDVCICN